MNVPTYGPYPINSPGTQWSMLDYWFGAYTMLGQAAWSDPNTGEFFQKVEVQTRDGKQVNVLFKLAFDVSRPDYSGPLPGQVKPYFPTQDSFTYGAFAGSPPPGGPMMAQIGGVTGVGLDYSTLYSPMVPQGMLPAGKAVHPAGCSCSAGQAVTVTKLGPIVIGSTAQGKSILNTWFKNGFSIRSVSRTVANGRTYDVVTVMARAVPHQVWFDVTSFAVNRLNLTTPGSYA
jgi:hypothetical protein